MKRALAKPEVKQRRSEALKRAFAKPEVRQRRIDGLKRALAKPKVRQRKSRATKRTWANPKVRQRRSEGIQRAWNAPEARLHWSEAIKRGLAKPEVRQRKSAAGKRTWANPKVRQRRIDGMQRAWNAPEARQRRVERQKASWTQERRDRLSRLSRRLWEKRKGALKEASRWPANWEKKPPLWQVVAEILLSRDGYVSNEELGEIMDTEQIKCPYGHSWRAVLSSDMTTKSNAATAVVAKVRRWVKMPGRSHR
jgi:hypothetical protein